MVFMEQMSFCNPTTSVKALKGTQSTNPNQWPGLILSSSTTGLPDGRGAVPLHQLSNASTFPSLITLMKN